MNVQKILVTAAAGGVLAVGIAASGVSYHNYQQEQAQADRIIAQQAKLEQEKTEKAKKAEADARVAQYNKLFVECQKGKSIYDKLSQTLKVALKDQVPQCGHAVTNL